MGSRETTVLLTRQPLRGCVAELWALTSTCSRQPPPRLRESSLVSAAACGPGYSRGRRGLVTHCWPFMWVATQAPGWTQPHKHLRAEYAGPGLCTQVCRCVCVHLHVHPFHTHAHMLTFRPVLISTHTGMAGVVCAQDTEAQRHQCRQIHADPCRLMHVSFLVGPEQACKCVSEIHVS